MRIFGKSSDLLVASMALEDELNKVDKEIKELLEKPINFSTLKSLDYSGIEKKIKNLSRSYKKIPIDNVQNFLKENLSKHINFLKENEDNIKMIDEKVKEYRKLEKKLSKLDEEATKAADKGRYVTKYDKEKKDTKKIIKVLETDINKTKEIILNNFKRTFQESDNSEERTWIRAKPKKKG
ncbi:MAG: hypothetical protein Tsb0021_04220 [Chlamydiales bacterium]